MASAADLRSRIEELSLAITWQREILRDLEETRRDAQSQLNSLLDPMSWLPLDISSDIFMRCLPADSIPSPHSAVAPLLLMNVCRSWGNIALSTPSLWTAIRIESPHDGFQKLVSLWISRAQNRLLAISLEGPDPYAYGLVSQHAHELQTLELRLSSSDEITEIQLPLPSLRKMTISKSAGTKENPAPFYFSHNADACVELMCAAPNLVECMFDEIHYPPEASESPNRSHFTLSRLKHLSLGTQEGCESASSALILRHLTLPALNDLTISSLDISQDDFLAFLTRSSPPLLSLQVDSPSIYWPSDTAVQRLWELLPNLTALDVEFGDDSRFSADGFALLAGSGEFLPTLRSLTFRRVIPGRQHYEMLVKTLSARRASPRSQLEAFRFVLRPSTDGPDNNVLVSLRKLVADGMEIHVGPPNKNYV